MNSRNENEESNEILENIYKKFDVKKEIINFNNDLKEINNNIYWHFHFFLRKRPPELKEDINSLDELKEKFCCIKKISNYFLHIALNQKNFVLF